MIDTENDLKADIVMPPAPIRALRIYPHVDVTLTYQNFGSAWLCILRGKTEDIHQVFNAFWNFGATNGEYQFFDHAQTVATFWSDADSLAQCFYRMIQFSAKHQSDGRKANLQLAQACMNTLRGNCHEAFLDFDSMIFMGEVYATGTISAERPDDSFKDAVIIQGHKDKESDKKDLTVETE